MSSEEISTIAVDPFVRKFVFAIIQSIRAKNFPYEEKQVIHADLVPKVSEKVMLASLGKRITPKAEVVVPEKVEPQISVLKKRDLSGLVAPMARPVTTRAPIAPPIRRAPLRVEIPRVTPHIRPVAPPIMPREHRVGLSQDYGKITPLLNDPSVSAIECHGAGKPITITRAGQKQITKIILSAENIKDFLKKIADATHIPLLEGVFRAAVDNFSVNAVISEIIGSKFMIKKQTAYAMLER